jgi:uncharacterized membrane protein YtjA (UPF0391 family)
MVNWTVTFFVVALLALVLGAGVQGSTSFEIGKVYAALGAASLSCGALARAILGR